jgi:YVTN family beta-propeller protein
MIRNLFVAAVLSAAAFASSASAWAGQAPAAASAPDIPVSHHDRVYAAEQFSNTVSVTDPAENKLLGVIRLGEPVPANFSPLYKGQLLVHGMGFSPDHRTLDVVSIGSNSVTFIDTATNAVKHITYVGRSPHEAFFTQETRGTPSRARGRLWVGKSIASMVIRSRFVTFVEPARPASGRRASSECPARSGLWRSRSR